jgi:hypothetical protein
VPDNENTVLHFGIAAADWLKEKPLSAILRDPYYSDGERIEKAIDELQSKVSYGIPNLLKPVYDIAAPKSMLLRFIECGAFKPFTRFLIEENIPRETALRISNVASYSETSRFREEGVRQTIKMVYEQLNYWDQIQLQSIYP